MSCCLGLGVDEFLTAGVGAGVDGDFLAKELLSDNTGIDGDFFAKGLLSGREQVGSLRIYHKNR